MTILRKRLSSLALAIILALGAQAVLFLAAGCVHQILSIFQSPAPTHAFEEVFILSDGTPAIDSHSVDDEGRDVLRTLDGKRIQATERWRLEVSGSHLPIPAQKKNRFVGLYWSQRLVRLSNPAGKFPVWYLLHDGELSGHGYLVGYDRKTKLPVSYIGRNGPRTDMPPREEQFPVNGKRMFDASNVFLNRYIGELEDYRHVAVAEGQSALLPGTIYLLADDGLMKINIREQTAKFLRKDAHLISAAMVREDSIASESPRNNLPPRWKLLLRTPDRVIVTDLNGKELQTYPLPKELRDVYLTCFELSDNTVLIRTGEYFTDSKQQLFWIDPTGKIIRHENIKLDKYVRHTDVLQEVLLSPIIPGWAYTTFFVCNPWAVCDKSELLNYWSALSKAIAQNGLLQLLVANSTGVILAVFCYRRQRKYALPWTWMWTGFVLLFGVPAFIGYLVHRRWPARLACPNCAKPAPRDRPACAACGRDFPPPTPKGTEVFA